MKDISKKKVKGTESRAAAPSSPRRRSRRTQNEEPEFSPGAEVMTSTKALVLRGNDTKSKAEADKSTKSNEPVVDSSSDTKTSTSKSDTTAADQSSKSKREKEEFAETEDQQDDEKGTDSNDTFKTSNESGKEDDFDDSSDEDNEEGGGFEMPSPYAGQPPNLEQKFDWLLANINSLVEKRLEIFAKKAGLNPSVATMNAADLTEDEDDVKKPEFLDPVKPSTVENLPEREKKTSFSFSEAPPPSRVEKMQRGSYTQEKVKPAKEPSKRRVELSNTPSNSNNEELEKVKVYLENPEFIYRLIKENEANKGKFTKHIGFNKEDVYLSEDGFNFSYINPWEKPGLNIVNDSTLSKLAQAERVYKLFDDQGDQRPKYDCTTDS